MKKIINLLFIGLSILILTSCTPQVDNSPRATLGNQNAKVVIEEFSDFQCPACGVISPMVEQIVRKYLDKVRLDFYHYPLSYHQNAFIAAEAAECANDQGKFWEFGKVAFANQTNLTEDNLKLFAKNLKLDTTKFNQCLDSGAKKAKIKNDMAEGDKRDLQGTPSFYVNGTLVPFTSSTAFESYIKSLVK